MLPNLVILKLLPLHPSKLFIALKTTTFVYVFKLPNRVILKLLRNISAYSLY